MTEVQDLSILQQQLVACQAELKRLQRINQALVARIEAGADAAALAPYAAFQHATTLSEQVRVRTAELQAAYEALRRSTAESEHLRQSERWIRTITDNVPAMLAYLSADGRYLFTNQQYDAFYGVARGSLQHADLESAHGLVGRQRLQPYINEVLTGQTVQFEIAEQNAAGEPRFLLKSYVPHFESNEGVVGFFVLSRDITERKQTSEALRRANLHLEQRVQQRTADLTELNQQLAQAKNLAEQANASKSQFLAAVTHDVLQPLNAARLFNGALLDKQLAADAEQLAQSVAGALDDMSALLKTLGDLSRLETGQIDCHFAPLALQPLLQRLLQEYQPQALARGIRLRAVFPEVTVLTDQALLLRIIRNLLSNALRYTPRGGKVLLGVRRKGEHIELMIVDNGMGIAEEHQQKIFIAFNRLAGSPHPNEKGLGLGLAIVDKLCQLLHHPLRLYSELGKGSVFVLRLPLTQASCNQLVAPSPALQPDGWQHTKLLWVLDDDPAIARAMRQLLTGWGFSVQTFTSSVQLFACSAVQVAPDLLIVDYQLAEPPDGISVALALRRQLGLTSEQLPVILISALPRHQLAAELLAEVQLVLTKPVKPLKLRIALQNLLNAPLHQIISQPDA